MKKAWETNVLSRLDIWTEECMDKDIFQKPEDKEGTKTEFIRWKVLTGEKDTKKTKKWMN